METEQRLQQEKQEKEEAQKQPRHLQLKPEHEQQQKKCRNFIPSQQKLVAVNSPTNNEGKASVSKPDESQLDRSEEGAMALRAQQRYAGEGRPRERAKAAASQ